MTSVLAAQPHSFPTKNIMSQTDSPTMAQIQDPSLRRRPKAEPVVDKSRGRRRSRAENEKDDTEAGDTSPVDGDGGEGHSSGTDGPSRKRRRSRKGLDKKFECPQEGCGKSYSRAEHLYRHQLNHTPKQIYNCDFPDCTRTFVRQDLCNRHKDRHTAKGSQLHRKDSMMGHAHASPTTDAGKPLSMHGSNSPEVMRPGLSGIKSRTNQLQYQSPQEMSPNPYSPVINQQPSTYSGTGSGAAEIYTQSTAFKRSNSDSMSREHTSTSSVPNNRPQRHASFGVSDCKPAEFSRPALQTAVGPYGLQSSASNSQSYPPPQASPQGYVNQQNFTPFTLPPPGFSTSAASTPIVTRETESTYPTSMSTEYSNDPIQHQQSGPDMMLLDQMTAPNTMPVFGGEGYNRSPFAIPEDFVAYLFSNQQLENAASPMGPMGPQAGYANYPDSGNQYYAPYFANDVNMPGFFPPNQQPHHPMAVTSLLDTSLPETVLSEEKSQQIIDLIKERFNETDHAPVARQKEALLEGDRSEDSHMMSRKMMQTYIGSYWVHFSAQVPILHKPTFSPDKTPNLLLIAMIAIGASCLDKMHGYEVTQAGAELSNFLAWHLRWEIFSDYHFRPPAKLWVFQALLLLELYEKMYSTRALHERAHIHHATTITLMRRGSSLIGRSALDSPPSVRDDKQGLNGSRHSSASGANTPDEWWNHWVTNEATRRAAFAAFVIDSTHATMFGHSTVMVAHEMRLPLPCDEALWNATNSAEVGRIEAGLHANGVKPISFLEGLKRTLNAQEVRTNSFGRSILMAGLLSVSWHMNQRDLQVNSLGVSQALGGRDKWRGSLTRAFDLWKQDFDRSLLRKADSVPGPYMHPEKKEENAIFQSRTVLHHLAHMAMHVDIVDCQIFARAKRLLGRTIGAQDLNSAQRRMKDTWAPTAKARDATWYALRFLCSVLVPEESTYPGQDPAFDYSARDDVLMNRPWVMYFAALIVWSYGFALEGPSTQPIPAHYNFDAQVQDMRTYLRRLGGVRSPEQLKDVRGFNGCSGMLMVLRTTFEKTRWELLHEAALLLNNCIQLLGGAQS
ncbi:Zinc finger protein [Lachnellula hyalina]|uniref:Zinc finger protein n=1 Tax=Lachnellula hyalina TaxID=1316788 RepID=A0A8H8QW85_9HELO|nr:Zinc finger protein [Lachnellula hyalina]TVY22845.1 Zinc finger protein [Lachnellula hyalina]